MMSKKAEAVALTLDVKLLGGFVTLQHRMTVRTWHATMIVIAEQNNMDYNHSATRQTMHHVRDCRDV